MTTLTVAKLAERAGVRPDTIRYYERAGLLPEPARSAAGYRLYEERSLNRLQFIKGAQHTGLKLRQIRELLEVSDRGACPCGHTEAVLAQRITEIDNEITELRQLRRDLVRLRDRLPSDAECLVTAAPWPCEQAFIEAATLTEGRRKQ